MQYCKIPIIPTYLCIEGKIMLNETYLDVQCTIHFVSVYNEHVLSLCCDWLNPESRDPCLEDLRTNNKVDITVVDHLSWVGCGVSYPVHTVKWRNHFRTNKIQLYMYTVCTYLFASISLSSIFFVPLSLQIIDNFNRMNLVW